MDPGQQRYWPFDVLPPEKRTEQHHREIRFFETAHRAGYAPYVFDSESFGANAETRAGEIFWRGSGGRHWELSLVEGERPVLSAHVNDFDYAADALMRWLRGADAREIIELIKAHSV